MTYEKPPPEKMPTLFQQIDGMEAMTDRHFPNNTYGSIKVVTSKVRQIYGQDRIYVVAPEEQGARVWRKK